MCPWVRQNGLCNFKTYLFNWDQLFTNLIILLLWSMSLPVRKIIPHFPFSSILFEQGKKKFILGGFWRPVQVVAVLGNGMVCLGISRFLNYFLSCSPRLKSWNPLHLPICSYQSLLTHLLWLTVCVPSEILCWNLISKMMVLQDGGLWEVIRSWGWHPREWK